MAMEAPSLHCHVHCKFEIVRLNLQRDAEVPIFHEEGAFECWSVRYLSITISLNVDMTALSHNAARPRPLI